MSDGKLQLSTETQGEEGGELPRMPASTGARELLIGDLFCGAGGIAEGFRQEGFRSVFANDFDAAACRTFGANFPGTKVYDRPIQELSASDILKDTGLAEGDLDVLVGGPPCQGFSVNAPMRSATDERNHLFRHYVRLVLEGLRPRIVVFENVPGLVTMGDTLLNVSEAFDSAGYRVEYKILNAAHYGVPQERWRLLILGTRCPAVPLAFPAPQHFSNRRANFRGGRDTTFSQAVRAPDGVATGSDGLRSPVTVREAIDDLPEIANGGGAQELPYTGEPRGEFQEYCRGDAGSSVANHEGSRMSRVNVERFTHVPPGGSWRDIPFDLLPEGMKRARRSDHTRRYGRLDPSGLSGTVMTKCDPHWGSFVHYQQDRIITVREAARIQSFPDRFRFTGSITEQYRQVGNAVPPLLAKAIAHEIGNALSTTES
jgi:DNA (cytosine-5)-methyltransferase 1